MTDATTVNPRLATLGPSGWIVSPAAEFFPIPGARAGLPTCTWGDSMLDTYESFAARPVSALSFNSTTQVVTVTSASHGLNTGRVVRFWNFNYPSTRNQRLTAITRVDANTYTFNLPGSTDIPNGSMLGSFFVYPLDYSISCTHWLGLYQLTRGHPLNIVRNGAQNGETSRGALSRFSADVAVWNPALIIFQVFGLNDINANNNFSEAEIIANNRTHIDLCISTGARVLVLTTTPVVSGEGRGNAATMQRLANINRDAINYCRSKISPNLAVVDAYTRILNPNDATGYATAGRLRAADLVHYNYTGSALVLPECAKVLDAWFQPNTATSNRCKSVMDCHQGNKLTISSVSRSGNVTTVTTTGAHNKLVGESIRVANFAGYNDTAWAATTAYVVGNVRRPTAAVSPNGYGFRFEVTSISGTGTSGGSEPAWNYTLGAQTIDNPGANQVVWTCRASESGVFTIDSVPSSTTFTYQNPGGVQGSLGGASAVYTSSRNIWNNGLMQTGTGGTLSNGILGTAPARYNVANNAGTTMAGCTVSVGASTLGIGNSMTLTITSAAANDQPLIQSVGSTAMGFEILPGRKYQMEAFLKLTSTNWAATNITLLTGLMSGVWSTGETYSVGLVGGWDSNDTTGIQSNQTFYLKSGILDMTPPSPGSYITNASFSLQFTLPTGVAAATLTVEFGEHAINDVTP